jgi:hypothetical protein
MKSKLRNVYVGLCAGVLSLLAVVSAQAQQAPRVGLKGGLNLSNLYVNNVTDNNARVGWHAGVYGQVFSSEAFAIQPEVNYSTKGTGFSYVRTTSNGVNANFSQKFNLSYIDIPVLAVFKLGRAAEIQAGPYWSYLVHADIKNNDGNPNNEFDTIDRKNFNNWDAGLAGGIGFNLGRGAQLGVRYNYGLRPIATSTGAKAVFGNAKNQNAQLYLAFNFNNNDVDY